MYYVYFLQSAKTPSKTYVGFTNNLKRRFAEHNSGKSTFTNQYKPWELKSYFAFDSEETAKKFEEYLKTGSGIAFRNKHFL